jgi:hypothetical protein
MSDQHFPDDLHEIESALRSLAPQPAQIDSARLMFLAGQESVRAVSRREGRVNRGWRFATALSTALALSLAVVLVVRPEPQPLIVYRDAPAAGAPEPAEPETPPPPPAAIAGTPQGEPPAAPWDSLAASWLPAGGFRERQLAVLRDAEPTYLASAEDSGFRPVPHRELLDQYLRESGVERAAPPRAAAAFPWPFTQPGVP